VTGISVTAGVVDAAAVWVAAADGEGEGVGDGVDDMQPVSRAATATSMTASVGALSFITFLLERGQRCGFGKTCGRDASSSIHPLAAFFHSPRMDLPQCALLRETWNGLKPFFMLISSGGPSPRL
jgi:hypothetical protein